MDGGYSTKGREFGGDDDEYFVPYSYHTCEEDAEDKSQYHGPIQFVRMTETVVYDKTKKSYFRIGNEPILINKDHKQDHCDPKSIASLLRQQALNKLTMEERIALGVK